MKDPILRGPKLYTENGDHFRLVVNGGLHYIRGNRLPYFSLTASQSRMDKNAGWAHDVGGCCHELILAHWPELSDLAAMHLSDIDGAPMHAIENGWYDLAGALGHDLTPYHVGNSPRHFPLPPERIDPDKPWAKTEYRNPTQDECLQIFADHCRIGLEQAEAVRLQVLAELGPPMEDGPRPWLKSDVDRAKARWAEIAETYRPRWKREANECIRKHGLVVYGDAWRAA